MAHLFILIRQALNALHNSLFFITNLFPFFRFYFCLFLRYIVNLNLHFNCHLIRFAVHRLRRLSPMIQINFSFLLDRIPQEIFKDQSRTRLIMSSFNNVIIN